MALEWLAAVAPSVISAVSAERQMRFQERMSNTAIQRAARDARLAGVNPLMAGRLQASTPGGASFEGQDILGPVTSARVAKKQMELMDEQIGQIHDNRQETNARTARIIQGYEQIDLPNAEADRALTLAQARNLDAQTRLRQFESVSAANAARMEKIGGVPLHIIREARRLIPFTR